jgi:hypothetical protein
MAFTVTVICENCGKQFTKGPSDTDPRKVKAALLTCSWCGAQRAYVGDDMVLITD